MASTVDPNWRHGAGVGQAAVTDRRQADATPDGTDGFRRKGIEIELIKPSWYWELRGCAFIAPK